MRKTKIVCTLGPATDSYAMIKKLIKAGMNVARVNMSHGDHEEHRGRIELVKRAREELNTPVAILMDTKGPEIRIRTFADGKAELVAGGTFTLTTEDVVGSDARVSVTYPDLPAAVRKGDTILLNDGLIELKVASVAGPDVVCTVVDGGTLSDRKSINLPGINLDMPYLSEADRRRHRFRRRAGRRLFRAELRAQRGRRAAGQADLKQHERLQHPDHRQDREPRRRRQLRLDHRRVRRRDGRPRRHGRGNSVRGAAGHSEGHDSHLLPRGQKGHHGHADAGKHDRQPPSHARGDFGRGQRHLRRHVRHHAVRRDGGGQVPRRGGQSHVQDRRKHRKFHQFPLALL